MTTGQRRARRPDASSDLREFLEHFRPAGSTTYVGIVPDGTTVAATFNGEDSGEAQRWITSQNRARGIYFTCNPTPADLRKKPTKGDITAIAALWADIDPLDGNGRDWTAERGRLLALAEALAAFPLAPPLIIDSGNGIQPIWLLTNPIEANPEYGNTAEALCARQTLARWRCYGIGPPFVRIGGRIFYDSADLDAFIAANKFHSTAEADQAV